MSIYTLHRGELAGEHCQIKLAQNQIKKCIFKNVEIISAFSRTFKVFMGMDGSS